MAFLFGGQWEWIVVLAVGLLLFGNRIPGLARSLGLGIVEFRKGLKGESSEDKKKLAGGGGDGGKEGGAEDSE